MSIRCPRCGVENADAASACLTCATPLTREAADIVAPSHGFASPEKTETVLPTRLPLPASPVSGTSGSRAGGDALLPGADLGLRYQILSLLGRGGMGAVYLAHDRELGREVAVKLIAPEFLDDPGAVERFKREIHLSSLVTHPNVLRVYDLGEADGTRFLTMQFVNGRSLDGVLREDSPMPTNRVIAFFRQICEGLAAAHEQGILHRDLKPQNVMVDGADHVYLTDFGLATSQFMTAMTQTGGVLGTPHYMSPEQVKGEAIDARSDIFSLGVMLYQMLTGVLPFRGDSLFEVMIKRTHSAPPPAREVNPGIPDHLLGVLDRCLAIDKQQRYSAVREIITDLDAGTVGPRPATAVVRPRAGRRRRLLMTAAAVLVLVAGGTWTYVWIVPARATSSGEAAVSVPLVGVVPFVNRTGDASLDWAGEGVARLVADSLALSRHLHVVAPERVAALRSSARDASALLKTSADSGITHLLTGEILSGAGGFTVATRLVDTHAGTDLVSKSVEGASKTDIIGAANQVATAVRRGLRVPLTEQVDTYNADFATQRSDAYEIYVQGLNAVSGYRYEDAVRLFRTALEKAPDFTMAKFRLANVYASMGETGEATKQIAAAVTEASRLPDREARYVRALDAYIARRNDDATRQYKELVDRYPYDLEPRQFLSQLYLAAKRWREAIEQAKAMAQIDPGSHSTFAVLGSAYLGLEDYNQAIDAFRKYAEREPGSANAHHLLADAYRAQGVPDLAAAEYRKALAADPAFHFSTVSLAEVEALRGQPDEAERLLDPLVRDTSVRPGFRVDAAVDAAAILRTRGRFREAIAVLERAQSAIRAEKIREAMTIATRATSYVELGDVKRAEQLAREAVAKSPGVPTRYLFALANVQIAQGKTAEARATATQILKGAAPPSDPDRTEDKAAAYLRGLVFLKEGKAGEAREELSRAVALSGYEYSVYRLALARAYLQAGAYAEALATVKQVAVPGNQGEPRLDLELDRVRALLVEAEIHLALGRRAEAASCARRFLEAWTRADPGLSDLTHARRLSRVQ